MVVLWLLGLIFTIILGLGWGSYATMATYRLPRGESWSGKKPRCPSCGHELKFKDFAPIYAYVVSKGKCKFCGVPVTPVYLCTEIYTTLLFILSYLQFGFGELFLLVSTFGVFVAILTTTELESRVIPDKVQLLMFILAVAYRILVDGSIYGVMWGGLLALGVGYTYYAVRAKRRSEAFDLHQAFLDITTPGYSYLRLFVIFGITLNIKAFLVFLVLLGILVPLVGSIWWRSGVNLPVPYGGMMGVIFMAILIFWR